MSKRSWALHLATIGVFVGFAVGCLKVARWIGSIENVETHEESPQGADYYAG